MKMLQKASASLIVVLINLCIQIILTIRAMYY